MPEKSARSFRKRRSAIDPANVTFLHVSDKLSVARLVVGGISALFYLAIACIPLALRKFANMTFIPDIVIWGLPAFVLLITLWVFLLIPRQVRAIGYAERNEDLLIRTGIIFHKVMVVPYGRMQYIDVTMGPLERMLGISTLHLHTASPGTNAKLYGVPSAEADRLREQLSARGEAKLAGL